jgi:hypothetical protein
MVTPFLVEAYSSGVLIISFDVDGASHCDAKSRNPTGEYPSTQISFRESQLQLRRRQSNRRRGVSCRTIDGSAADIKKPNKR